MPRLIDETGGEKGSSATKRAAARRVRGDDAITGADQYPLGRAGVFRLEIAVEGIDQQHDLAPGSGGNHAIGAGGPAWQFATRAEPEPPFPEGRQQRHPVY